MEQNLQSIAGVVDFIEEHLDEELSLESLACEAGYSRYHLHRMFTGIVGMPVHVYVQRRRLTEAARLLIFSTQPVLDIALFAGYDSAAGLHSRIQGHVSPQSAGVSQETGFSSSPAAVFSGWKANAAGRQGDGYSNHGLRGNTSGRV